MSEHTQHNDQRELDHEPEFNRFIDAAMNRRNFLRTASAAGTVAFFATVPVAKAVAESMDNSKLMGFTAIPASTADTVIVPEGYIVERVVSWGDQLFPTSPKFAQSNDSKAQEMQYGDNTDGMTFFPLSEDRAVLVANNEYTNNKYLYTH
ncbi:Tat (twin-arginine translocation) pathway signal sequence [Enterovibrio nigricans DSM 22720]|uniref:Tat (Twin-arginine translocation) pathway signal sequence n=1 Tax=Enterovibrio nigricans DSM 22720 TaxID=1121868 RepID=A0A1T4V0Q4_9GAMM|nr:Tat (twin-arginine translocation) pathway signal sequence [Enterovibrio nigricans DSM 22720]